MQVWSRILDAIDRHGRAGMVTVAATRGSVPREAGARMVVHPDGAFSGTIGGGTLEWRAIALAQAMLTRKAGRRAELKPFILGPDMGQCCGGQVELLFEEIDAGDRALVEDFARREAVGTFVTTGRITENGVERRVMDGAGFHPEAALSNAVIVEGFGDERRPLLLFGAGHVGRALVLALAPLPFAVTWVDPRPDAFPAHVPGNVTLRRAENPTNEFDTAVAGSFVLVMTHSHQLDLALVGRALADTRFPYVGLIGSKSKRARFEKRMAAAGIDRARIDSLFCPIGVEGIKSKLPATIAAATVAQMIIRDEALRAEGKTADNVVAVRRGRGS